MAEEEHVAQPHDSGAIVLGERVGVELRKCGTEALLHLAGERNAPLGPVDGHELRQLVGTLNHARQRIREESAMRRVTRHLADEEERRVAQLHRLTRFEGQRGDLRRVHLRDQFADAAGDLHAVLIELALPEQTGEDAAPERLLVGDAPRRRALMGARAGETAELEDVEPGHAGPPC